MSLSGLGGWQEYSLKPSENCRKSTPTRHPPLKKATFMQTKCLRCLLWSSALHHLSWAKETSWLHGQQRAVDQYPYRRLWCWSRSQALQVMNCLRDIYPPHGGAAAARLGTAAAALLWWDAPSHRVTLGSKCLPTRRRVQTQTVIGVFQMSIAVLIDLLKLRQGKFSSLIRGCVLILFKRKGKILESKESQ